MQNLAGCLALEHTGSFEGQNETDLLYYLGTKEFPPKMLLGLLQNSLVAFHQKQPSNTRLVFPTPCFVLRFQD